MKTPKSKLAKKLAAYSLGIGGATFAATCADADIIYTPFTGTATLGNDLDLDIDQDGTADFTISMGTVGPNAYGTNTYYNGIAGATANAGVAAVADIFNFGAVMPGVINHGFGATISGQTQFYNSPPIAFQGAYSQYNPGNSYGQFAGVDNGGYVGIRFQDTGGTDRFGWIRVDITGGAAGGLADVEVSVNGFAYAIDESIVAGQIPEPSAATALGLLALGAIGLRRRRSNEAV